MAIFPSMAITSNGQLLYNKAQAGAALNFTEMKLGAGRLAEGQDPQTVSALIDYKFDVAISSITQNTELKVAVITGSRNNADVVEGTYICELGLYAEDPDVGEILYAYSNAGDQGDYFAPSSSGAFTWSYQINAAVGNAANVTATLSSNAFDHAIAISDTSFVTIEGTTQKEINKSIDTKLTAHLADNAISPESFSGTDYAKVQAALDLAVTDRRAVKFSRMYDITGAGSLVINKLPDAGDRNILYLIGSGGGIRKDDTGHVFTATTVATGDINVRGLRYQGVDGASMIVWDCDKLMRIKSTECDYQDVDTVASCLTTEFQSNDFFKEHIAGGSGNAFEFYKSYDSAIEKCLFEWRENGIVNTQAIAGANFALRIKGNILEGLTGTAIRLASTEGVEMEGNYLEGNAIADIDLLSLCGTYSMYGGSVQNNYINMIAARKDRDVKIRTASTVYALDDYVVSLDANGKLFKCTTAGTSGASGIVWPTNIGDTKVDGTVTWTAVDIAAGCAGIAVGRVSSSGNAITGSLTDSLVFAGNSCNGELYYKLAAGGSLYASGDYSTKKYLVYNRVIYKQGLTRYLTTNTGIPDTRLSGIISAFRIVSDDIPFSANQTKTVTINADHTDFYSPIKKEDLIQVYVSPCGNFRINSIEPVDVGVNQGQVKVNMTNLTDGETVADVTISVMKTFS